MSDARAATDGDLEYWRDTVRSARATNTGTLLAATASMEALLARISADAARIRELEAAGRTMINAMNHTHERGETFPARVALAAAHLERMLAAAPRP